MGDFLEHRISGGISYGSAYTKQYAVDVQRTASGARSPRLIHPYPLLTFRLILREPLASVMTDIGDLYDAVFGKFGGFRAQAFDDFTTAADGRSAHTKDDQPLAYISSGVYQLQKVYGLTALALAVGRPVRTIFKPVTGTTLIAKNGTLLSSGVSVDTTTGRVTITPAPTHPADVITGGCQFDIPVAFLSDLDIDQTAPAIRMLESIELEELLNP